MSEGDGADDFPVGVGEEVFEDVGSDESGCACEEYPGHKVDGIIQLVFNWRRNEISTYGC